jgi:hypothetical protein
VPGGAKLRAAIYQARTGAEVLGQVEQFFDGRSREELSDAHRAEPEDEASGFPEGALVCD